MGTRILLIEDEENIADYLRTGLMEEGYTVTHASAGASGWELLRTKAWDLILLDWWLPGEDGLSLLRRFRQQDRRTPVLFLTARDQVESRVAGLDSGADDYLCKPFDFEELLARVRALIRRRDNQNMSVLSYTDLVVDLAQQSVSRRGRTIALSAKELAVLIFFLQNNGEVLSRERIYEQVWKEPYDGLSNALAVLIMELRRKLEAEGSRLIHTVRGRGYSFGEAPVNDPEHSS
jgi:two-component system copper resistance phosphate regulon response regulator CusR